MNLNRIGILFLLLSFTFCKDGYVYDHKVIVFESSMSKYYVGLVANDSLIFRDTLFVDVSSGIKTFHVNSIIPEITIYINEKKVFHKQIDCHTKYLIIQKYNNLFQTLSYKASNRMPAYD